MGLCRHHLSTLPTCNRYSLRLRSIESLHLRPRRFFKTDCDPPSKSIVASFSYHLVLAHWFCLKLKQNPPLLCQEVPILFKSPRSQTLLGNHLFGPCHGRCRTGLSRGFSLLSECINFFGKKVRFLVLHLRQSLLLKLFEQVCPGSVREFRARGRLLFCLKHLFARKRACKHSFLKC